MVATAAAPMAAATAVWGRRSVQTPGTTHEGDAYGQVQDSESSVSGPDPRSRGHLQRFDVPDELRAVWDGIQVALRWRGSGAVRYVHLLQYTRITHAWETEPRQVSVGRHTQSVLHSRCWQPFRTTTTGWPSSRRAFVSLTPPTHC